MLYLTRTLKLIIIPSGEMEDMKLSTRPTTLGCSVKQLDSSSTPTEDCSTNSNCLSSLKTENSTTVSLTDQGLQTESTPETTQTPEYHTLKAWTTLCEQKVEPLGYYLSSDELPWEIPTFDEIRRDERCAYEIFGNGRTILAASTSFVTSDTWRQSIDEMEKCRLEGKSAGDRGNKEEFWTVDRLLALERQQAAVLDQYKKDENMLYGDKYGRQVRLKGMLGETREKIIEARERALVTN